MPRPTLTIPVHSQEIFGRLQIPHCRKDNRQIRTRIQSGRESIFSKTKHQGNGTSNGEQDIESSGLSTKDATCTSKTKLQEKSDPAMLRMLSLNQSVNYGM